MDKDIEGILPTPKPIEYTDTIYHNKINITKLNNRFNCIISYFTVLIHYIVLVSRCCSCWTPKRSNRFSSFSNVFYAGVLKIEHIVLFNIKKVKKKLEQEKYSLLLLDEIWWYFLSSKKIHTVRTIEQQGKGQHPISWIK